MLALGQRSQKLSDLGFGHLDRRFLYLTTLHGGKQAQFSAPLLVLFERFLFEIGAQVTDGYQKHSRQS